MILPGARIDTGERLTPRQLDVAVRMVRGKRRYQIADEMCVCQGSVAQHVRALLKLSGCAGTLEFVVKYYRRELPGGIAAQIAARDGINQKE